MRTAFVTGGTGFLGRTLLERLTDNGWDVTALYRAEEAPASWQAMGIKPVRADITDRDALSHVMPQSVTVVFHAAADTSSWRAHRQRQMTTNLDGTKAVIAAMTEKNAGRLIHVSSASVYGHHPCIITEGTPQKGAESKIGYVKSKALAEAAVRAATATGLDAVILNPGHIIGRYDQHNWARLFLLMDKDALPGVPPGGGCFANAHAVAAAMIRAVDKGICGENYILGGPHASFLDVAHIIARFLGKTPPKKAIAKTTLRLVAHLADLKSRLTGIEPDITPESVYFVTHDERLSSARARAVLDYEEVSLEVSLAQCYDWLCEAGLINRRNPGSNKDVGP